MLFLWAAWTVGLVAGAADFGDYQRLNSAFDRQGGPAAQPIRAGAFNASVVNPTLLYINRGRHFAGVTKVGGYSRKRLNMPDNDGDGQPDDPFDPHAPVPYRDIGKDRAEAALTWGLIGLIVGAIIASSKKLTKGQRILVIAGATLAGILLGFLFLP